MTCHVAVACAEVLVGRFLPDEHYCWGLVECTMALAAKASANNKEADSLMRDLTAANMAAMVSVVDMRRQETAGTMQHQAVAECGTALVLPPLDNKASALMMPPSSSPMVVSSSLPPAYCICGCGPFHHGGSPHATSLALTLPPWTSPTVDGQLRTVCQCARPCSCTGWCFRPHVPSPPDKVLPSHPHLTLEGLSTPSVPPKLLARATSRLGMPSLVPSLMASNTLSLLPYTLRIRREVHLSLGGGTAHPFFVGGPAPPPQKHTQHKHWPCCVGQGHGPQAPNPQEHLLCKRRHWPCTPNQTTSNGWACENNVSNVT